MWADSITTEEVEQTLRAADQLSGVPWAGPLLGRTKPILDRLRLGLANRESYRSNPLKPPEMSLLFEVRFARALSDSKITAEYEHGAGVGNTTIDFRVNLDPPWLVELVSLHESEAFRKATGRASPLEGVVVEGFVLSTNAEDPRQSEEGEMLKAQERIGNKVFEQGRGPIKFPAPNGAIHMLMVDARGYLGTGHGDNTDWRQIAYGPRGVIREEQHFIKFWTNPKTRQREPIMGLFEPGCPLPASRIAQERLHIIGFISEGSYEAGEIKEQTFYCYNPALFGEEQDARTALSHWPLWRTA